MLGEQTAASFRIIEIFQHPLGAKTAESQPKMLGGHVGHRVAFVEHHEVIGEKHTACAALFRGAAGIEVGEEERVVDDDDLRETQPRASSLVETALGVAVLP